MAMGNFPDWMWQAASLDLLIPRDVAQAQMEQAQNALNARQAGVAKTNHETLMDNLIQARIMPQAQIDPRGTIPLPSANLPISARAREMFLKRVGGLHQELRLNKDDFLHCQPYNDEIILFYLLRGKEGIVRQPIDLFPSDTLVAQFRLLLGE